MHDSLVNYLGNTRPRMLLALHEESAVAVAHGYAKITGKPMGLVLHSNVGLLHVLMAIFNAWCERVPMLLYGCNGPMDAAARRPWVDWMQYLVPPGGSGAPLHQVGQPAGVAGRDSGSDAARVDDRANDAMRTDVNVIFDSALQEQKLDKPLPVPDVALIWRRHPPIPLRTRCAKLPRCSAMQSAPCCSPDGAADGRSLE